MTDALNMLGRHKARRGLSEATMRMHSEKGGRLIAELGADRNVCALTLLDAEGYVDTRRTRDGVTLSTIAKEWGLLRAALRLAARHDLYPADPSRIWPDALRNVGEARTRWLTVEEARLMALALPGHRRDHFLAYLHTGMRHSELYKVTAEDVDPVKRSVFVRGEKGDRDHARRHVPLTAEAWEVFARRMAKHPEGPIFPDAWGRSAMARALKKASRKAEIPRVNSANDLRRTFATWLLHAGVPEATTIRLMGHVSSKMVRRVYAQHSAGLLRDAIDKLPSLRNRDVTAPHRNDGQSGRNGRRNPTK